MVIKSLSSRSHTSRSTNNSLKARLNSLITSARLSPLRKGLNLTRQGRTRATTPKCWRSINSLRGMALSNSLEVILNCCGARMRKLSDQSGPTLLISERHPSNLRLKILKLTIACLNGMKSIMVGRTNSPQSPSQRPLKTLARSMVISTQAIS